MSASDQALRRSAWAAWWFFAAVVGAAVPLAVVDGSLDTTAEGAGQVGFVVVLLAFPLIGLLILRRQPRNTIGWLLAGIGVVWGLGGLADNYARYGLVVDPGSLPRPDVAAALAAGIWAPALGLVGTFLVLLYPDGHLPEPRWRAVGWLSAGTIVALTVVLYLSPGQVDQGSMPPTSNPLAWESAAQELDVALAVLVSMFAVCIVACATGLVWRFRRSRGVERLQLKWLATAGAVMASVFLVGIVASFPLSSADGEPAWLEALNHLSFLLFALLPVAIGIAVLRHRLYDIDVVINRTLVYGSLTAALAGVYLGSVLLLQTVLSPLSPLTDQSDLEVAGSTLAVAALFRPVRARIQSVVDRRFYRSRYDAVRTLESFTGRIRQQVDLEAIGSDLRVAAAETVHPTHVSLWLRS